MTPIVAGVTPKDRYASDRDYLLAAGWLRDGDDPGLWKAPIQGDVEAGGWANSLSFGEAFQIQLEADGVEMET